MEPEAGDEFDYDSLVPVNGKEVNIADTYYAYMSVNQQSGDTVYYPIITLHLSEDGSGYYETEYECMEITWKCEQDGNLTLQSDIFYYPELYVEHEDGFDMLWIMMQMGENVVWFY